jgi:GNAT superfamily N-acetyltransferase
VRLPGQEPNELEQFVGLPGRIHAADSLRTPLLDAEQADLVDRAGHPFYREAEAELFLARRDGDVVGRIAAIVNHGHNDFESRKHGRPVRSGFFGFYEAIEDQAVADALLDAAAAWLREQGCDEMLGPSSPSQHYYYGSRAMADETRPYTASRFLETYNPEYYNRQYEAHGLAMVQRMFGYDADLHSEAVDRVSARFERTIADLMRSTGLEIRRLDMDDFDAEIGRAVELINRSLEDNWGFSPMSRAELKYMADQMRWLIDPELILFAELGGEPVGISLSIPDYNRVFAAMEGRLSGWPAALRFGNLPLVRWLWPHGNAWMTEQVDNVRVIALGVVPTVWRGASSVRRELLRLGPALVYSTFDNARRAGYRWLTASWILEENRSMRAPFALAGIEHSRVWRVYRQELL